MGHRLHIADNLSLPIDFATERVAFLARTGAGKSGGMRVLFEQYVLNKLFSVFIDPKGDAWGVRAAGIGKGLPVLVLGGDHGDIPIEATGGKFIAEFLVRERVPTVLDISDFETKQMWRFMADFTKTLYRLNRDVCPLFLDEADMVAGEKFYDPHTLHGIQLIQNKGRHRGFGFVVASQRSAILNKTVLFASGTLIAMQTTGPNDIKAVKEWLKYAGTEEATNIILAGLPTLKTREAFVYSPQILGPEPIKIYFNSFQTFDSMRTPKPGEIRQQPKSLAEIDLSAVQRDMAATIEEVKANDPQILKSRIVQLKRDLEKAQKIVPQIAPKDTVTEIPLIPVKEIEALTAEVAGFRSDYISKLERIAQGFEALNGQNTINQIEQKVGKLLSAIPNVKAPVVPARALPPKAVARGAAPRVATTEAPGDLTKAERLVLRAFYWTRADRDISAPKIGFYSGYSHKSGGFSNTLSSLRTKGFLEGYKITDAGEDLAATYAEARPSGLELREWLRPKLTKCENEILDVLVANPGIRLDSETLAQQTVTQYSHTSGGWSNSLSKLRSLEAAEGYGREGVKAADVFFE